MKAPEWFKEQGTSRIKKIYYKRSRAEAIKANCIDCSGGSLTEAKACTIYGCPMWIFRPGSDGTIPDWVPSEEILDQELAKDPRSIALSKRMKKYHENKE